MKHLTKKELDCLSELMENERLAAKKAKLYGGILTDTALSECLNRIGAAHENRFSKLMSLLGGEA